MYKQIGLSLMIWLVCSGFSLSPDTWIEDIAKMTNRTTPRYNQIKFWDQNQNNFRGFRAIFYTLPLESENRQVDARLHNKMVQMLSCICQDLITLESFDNPTQKLMVEAVLRELVDQWKQKGTIDPNYFFSKLPFLDVDLIVLMERTKYDQFIRNDEKYLTIGVNVGVFELDYGQPIYMDRTLNAVPWFGEQTSYAKAEHVALLKVADKVGERLKKAADIINQSHKQDVLAAKKENRQKEKLRMEQMKDQDQDYKEFAKQIDAFLKDRKDPKEVIDLIRNDVNELNKILRKSPGEQTDADRQNKKAIKDILTDRLGQFQLWLEDQDRRRNGQVAATPQKEPGAAVPVPKIGKSQLINQPIPDESQTPVDTAQPETAAPAAQPAADTVSQIPAVPLSGNVFDRKWIVPGNSSGAPVVESPNTQPETKTGEGIVPGNVLTSPLQGDESAPDSRLIPLGGNSLISQPVIPKDFIQKMQTVPAKSAESVTDASPSLQPDQAKSVPPLAPAAANNPAQKVGPNKPYVPKKPLPNPNLLPPKKVNAKKP